MIRLREAARTLLKCWHDNLNVRNAMGDLASALASPPPDLPEVCRQIDSLLYRHELLIKSPPGIEREVNQGELTRLKEDLVSLWERSGFDQD